MAAVALAVVGVVATLWRPTSGLVPVDTPLSRFGPEVLEAARAYRRPGDVGRLVATGLELAVPVLLLVLPAGRGLIRRLAGPPGSWWRGGLVAAGIAVLTSLARLPVTVWLGYVRDTRWGFNTADPLSWARDWLLSGAVGWLITFVAGAVLVGAARRWPASWHWRLVGVGTLLAGVLTLLHPVLIQPLFYDTEPLAPGPVRAEVAAVLESAGEPEVPILVGDASRRTTRINAFVSGLGPSRRVVLFDNLLVRPPAQVGAVVAHELAHRRHHDLARSVLLGAAGMVVGLLVVRRLWEVPALRRLVGVRSRGDPRLAAVAVVAVVVVQIVAQPLEMAVSRRAEAAADARSLQWTGDPGALVRIARAFTVRDLARPSPPAVVHVLWGTHPAVHERIGAAAGFAVARGIPLPGLAAVRRAERDLRHPAVEGPLP